MKKVFLFFCIMLFSTTVSYAQEQYLTEEEKTVTEKDLDAAYLAPSSKFIGKKWYIDENNIWLINANGNIKCETTFIDTDYGDTIHIKRITRGIWKRNKQYLNMTELAKQVTYIPDASELKKYSLRKQDEIKQDYATATKNRRNKYNDGHHTFELRKVTNDYIIFDASLNGGTSTVFYLFSQKMLNELRKREQEAKAKKATE